MTPANVLRSAWRQLNAPRSAAQRNEHLLVLDAAGVGLINGVAVFLSVLLVRLGASELQVGLITAIPALAAVLLSLPVGAFLAHRAHLVPWLNASRTIYFLAFPLIGLMPVLLPGRAVPAILVVWTAVAVPAVVYVVAVSSLMTAIADGPRRMPFLSRRWSAATISNALAVSLIGQVSRVVAFPLNYLWVFTISLAGTGACYWLLRQVMLPPRDPAPATLPLVEALRRQGREMRANHTFLRFIAAQFVYHSGLQLVVPLLPLYWVREVQASDSAIGAINNALILVAAGGYFLWTHIAHRRGGRLVLLVCSLGLSLYPLQTAATRQEGWLILWAGLAGLFAAGIDLTFFDTLATSSSLEQRPVYVGVYTTSANLAAFLAPLLGTQIAAHWGLGPALVAGGVLRLLGFGLLLLLRIGANPV